MWMLFIMSLVDNGETKVTLYNHYDSEQACEVMQKQVAKEFISGEKAFCHKVTYLKGKTDK